MIRTVVRLVIVLLITHALYQFLPLYLRYQQFKDDVKQTALFARGAAEAELVERVMGHAAQRQVPLAREEVLVQRVNTQVFINARYLQPVKVLPWYTYDWIVSVATTAYVLPQQ